MKLKKYILSLALLGAMNVVVPAHAQNNVTTELQADSLFKAQYVDSLDGQLVE